MTCSYRTCGNRLPTARLPERPESVRLSGTLCRVLAVLAAARVRRRHPVTGADAPGPGPGRAEAHHHGPPGRLGHQGRRRHWPGRRRCPFRPGQVPARPAAPGRYPSSVLSSAPASSAAALNARLRRGAWRANADSERATGRPQIVQLLYSATGNRRGSGARAYRRFPIAAVAMSGDRFRRACRRKLNTDPSVATEI